MPVSKHAYVFVLLGLLTWMGGHGTDAVDWLDMAGEIEAFDEDGVSRASLVTIVMTTVNSLRVHPAADEQQM